MSLVPDARVLYARAFADGFAMPAFNVCNLEMAQGCLGAAEDERAPVILQAYPGDLDHGAVVYTDPDEAERFVSESGADTLAVSVGSEHTRQAAST